MNAEAPSTIPQLDPVDAASGSTPDSFFHLLRLALVQASANCLDPIQYLSQALHALCELPGAHGGAIWAQLPNGSAAIIDERDWYQATQSDPRTDGPEWQSTLQSAILVQHPRVLASECTVQEATRPAYVLIPVRSSGEVRAILTLAIGRDCTPRAFEPDGWMDYQTLLELQFEDVIEMARTHRPERDAPRAIPSLDHAQSCSLEDQPSILDFAARIGRELDHRSTAFALVNELKSLTHLGRIGLFFKRGSACRISALSGVASINRRSDSVRSLEALANQTARLGCEIWHPEDSESTTESLQPLLDLYYARTDSRSIAMIPIRSHTEPSADPNDIGATLREPTSGEGPVIAVLSIEGLRESISKESIAPLLESVQPIIASAVSRAARVQRIPVMPVWLALGDLLELMRGHRKRQAAIVCMALGCLIATMLLVTAPMELRVDGSIQPSEQCRLYCEVSGTVQEILIRDGAHVMQGERLLTLTNPQLEADYQRVIGEREEIERSLSSLRNHLNANRITDESQSKALRKEKAGLEARLASLHQQAKLLEEKRSKLVITSPITGQSITWDIRGRLSNRPVEPGQHLLTIADPSQPWLLELRVPDRLSSYLREAIRTSKGDEPPVVEFALASDPRQCHRGFLERVSDGQVLDDSLGMVTLATVRLDPSMMNQIPHARPGTEVLAQIQVGKVSLGYSFLFEFHDWIQRMVFRYLG